MKVRHGFVSNSSSSSFIIAVPSDNTQWLVINTNLVDVIKKVNDDVDIKDKNKLYYIEHLQTYYNENYYDDDSLYNVNRALGFLFIHVLKHNITNIFTSKVDLYKYYVDKANEVLNYYASYNNKVLGKVEDYISIDDKFNVEYKTKKITAAKFTESDTISLNYGVKDIEEIKEEWNKYKKILDNNKFVVMLTFNRDGEGPKTIEENIIAKVGYQHFITDPNIEVLTAYEG